MAAYNHLVLLGNVTRDPQLSYTQNQTAVVDWGLAVNRKWTGADGQSREDVCFIDCRAFGKTAELVQKYVAKGNLLLADGYLGFEKWDKDGETHSRHRFMVQSVQFMPRGKNAESQAGEGGKDAESERR